MSATYKFLPPELADRLHGLGVSMRRPLEGAQQGLHRSPNYGSSVEFADYREYTPGDPPNRIDWSVYARSDRYVIRRYQEETNVRAYILLDTSESMAFRDLGKLSKMDYACYLAASLLFVLVSQSDAAGLTLFNDGTQTTLPPVSSMGGLKPMLLALEAVKPTGPSKIEASLHTLAEQIKRRSLIILISDLLQNPEETIRGIRHLQHNKHEVLVLHVLDAAEITLNFSALHELRELETGLRLPLHGDEVRNAYNQEVQKYLEEIRRGCLGSQATYHLVDTRVPVEEMMHSKFA